MLKGERRLRCKTYMEKWALFTVTVHNKGGKSVIQFEILGMSIETGFHPFPPLGPGVLRPFNNFEIKMLLPFHSVTENQESVGQRFHNGLPFGLETGCSLFVFIFG